MEPPVFLRPVGGGGRGGSLSLLELRESQEKGLVSFRLGGGGG